MDYLFSKCVATLKKENAKMKFTATQLRRIIKEEISRMLDEEEAQQPSLKPGFYFVNNGASNFPGVMDLPVPQWYKQKNGGRIDPAGYNVITTNIDPAAQTVEFIVSTPHGNQQPKANGKYWSNVWEAIFNDASVEEVKQSLLKEYPPGTPGGVFKGELPISQFVASTTFKEENLNEPAPVAKTEPAKAPVPPAAKTVSPAAKSVGPMNKPASSAEKMAEARRRR